MATTVCAQRMISLIIKAVEAAPVKKPRPSMSGIVTIHLHTIIYHIYDPDLGNSSMEGLGCFGHEAKVGG